MNPNGSPVSSSNDSVEQLTEEELTTYLSQKTKGANNFSKGNSFEIHFSLLPIARCLGEYFDKSIDYTFQSPAPNHFVDDLVVITNTNYKECYQMKNVQNLSWGTGKKKSLTFDFFYQTQADINQSLKLYLIVPDSELRNKLTNSMPISIKKVTVVEHFPPVSIGQLIKTEPLRSLLAKISTSANPPNDRLESLANAILARWINSGGLLQTSDLIRDKFANPFLRSKRDNKYAINQLRTSTKSILDKIPDFYYFIERGYFHYQYRSTEQTLRFDCFSEQFEIMQNWLEREIPVQFEGSLEEMLMTWSN